jgi:cell wall integrity and stress response component
MKFLVILLPVAAAVGGLQLEQSAEDPILGIDTVHGCYSSSGELQQNGTSTFNSQGSCTSTCRAIGASVAATQASGCYCGDKYPPAGTLVDDGLCDEPCPGYADNACGGSKTFTVYNTGLKLTVDNSTDVSSTSQVNLHHFSLNLTHRTYAQPLLDINYDIVIRIAS